MTDSTFERKINSSGSNNPKYVDLLEEDKPLAGQKFTCLSFVSPENILKQKEIFYFQEFLKNWDFSKSLEKYHQFLNYVSYKYNLDFENLMKDLTEFKEEESNSLHKSSIEDDFKTFLDHHEEELDKQFGVSNSFQTHTRGIKIRGTFPTQEEAEIRCKMLRELDPNHDVFVGPVGLWMPWDPEAYKTGKVEYLEDELNQLMHEKRKNETKAKNEFDKRVKVSKQEAIIKNKELAAETGNKLTQNITADGELVNIKEVNTLESQLGNDITAADIRKELFEGENIVTDKKTDHGLSDLLVNQEATFELSDVKDAATKSEPVAKTVKRRRAPNKKPSN
jgi:hypothetical protein